MIRTKIVHIFGRSVFLKYYLSFLKMNFSDMDHIFLIYGKDAHTGTISYPEYGDKFKFIDIGLTPSSRFLNPNVIFSHKFREDLKSADVIIAHALHRPTLNLLLFYPKLLKKTFWIVWGEELNIRYTKITTNSFVKEYLRKICYSIYDYINKKIMSKIKYVALQKTEYQQLKKYYNPDAIRIILKSYYPYHYKQIINRDINDNTTNILLGHSGWRGYGHLEALDILSKYKEEKIQIYIPLSYGETDYINEVVQKATLLFGNKIKILSKFMNPDDYNQLLSEMDIAIFNEPVQTGMGNIHALLGFGKKIYLNDSGQNKVIYDDYGFITEVISSIESRNFSEFIYNDVNVSNHNISICKNKLDDNLVIEQWKVVFSIYNANMQKRMQELGMVEEQLNMND